MSFLLLISIAACWTAISLLVLGCCMSAAEADRGGWGSRVSS